MAAGKSFAKFVLDVQCPKCRRGNGHWCRDEQGKAIHPHVERRRAALALAMGAMKPLNSEPQVGVEGSARGVGLPDRCEEYRRKGCGMLDASNSQKSEVA